MALGGGANLRMAQSVPATARALRKTGGHSRGIPVLGVCFDMLALPASRLGGGLKLALPAMHWRRADQQLSLGYRRIGSNTSTSSGNRCIVPTHGKWEPMV